MLLCINVITCVKFGDNRFTNFLFTVLQRYLFRIETEAHYLALQQLALSRMQPQFSSSFVSFDYNTIQNVLRAIYRKQIRGTNQTVWMKCDK